MRHHGVTRDQEAEVPWWLQLTSAGCGLLNPSCASCSCQLPQLLMTYLPRAGAGTGTALYRHTLTLTSPASMSPLSVLTAAIPVTCCCV